MRMYVHASVTAQEVHDRAGAILAPSLKFTDYSQKCTAFVLLNLLLYATARMMSLSRACQRLSGVPSRETLRAALLATLPPIQELEQRINRGLGRDLPKALRRRPHPVAIDFHKVPYYGTPHEKWNELNRSSKEKGTTRFHVYATACVIRQGHRFTVATTWVLGDESRADVVKRLLQYLRNRGVKTLYLLLDREFYTVDVVRCLQAGRRPFVMPVMRHGRKPKDVSRSQSTWRFTVWKTSGWATQTWCNTQGRRATVDICVSGRYYRDKNKRRRRQVLVFACWRVRQWSPLGMRETYRRRFGIETSYRQLEQARIRTATDDPVRRLLFIGVALILRNAWVWFHLMVLATRLRGGAVRLHLDAMVYEKMLHMLERYVELLLGDESLLCAQLQL
jgi:hypothetical protein